jgi:hypothetical protein
LYDADKHIFLFFFNSAPIYFSCKKNFAKQKKLAKKIAAKKILFKQKNKRADFCLPAYLFLLSAFDYPLNKY